MKKQIFFSSFVEECLNTNSDICNDIIQELNQLDELLEQEQKCGEIIRNSNGKILFKCSLCIKEVRVFENFDCYEGHLSSEHAQVEWHDISSQNNGANEKLCVELKKMERVNFARHSNEFLKEIEKVIDNDNDDKTELSNDLENQSLEDATSTQTISITEMKLSQPAIQKRKKKRTPGYCDICKRAFNDLNNLRVHKMIHTGEMPYQCEECGKRFRQYNKLKIHHITHTNKKPYTCDICGKGFRFSNYLSVHRRLHSGEKPYGCKYCDESFHSLHNRRMHQRTQHLHEMENIASLSYAICKSAAPKNCSELQPHNKVNASQIPVTCHVCNKCFSNQSEFMEHQLLNCKNKRYECELCQLRFQRRTNYAEHLKIHTNVKAYACQICHKAFSQHSALYGHMKSHSGSAMQLV